MLSPARPDLSRAHVLVVEDYEGMRGILRDILGRAGATRIAFANNGQDAIAQLERHSFDVVLCDLHLGQGLNGQQVLEEARHRQLLPPHAVWLMVSAEKTAEMVTGTVESRPDDYLIKPITETLLFTRLARQMAKKKALAPIEQAVRDREYLRALNLTEAQLGQANPHAWDLKRLKADLALHTGNHDHARDVYREALAQRNLPWAHLGLAKIHFLEGHYDDARRELEQVTQGNRAYLEAHDWLARSLDKMGDLEGAQAVLNRALTTSPRAPLRQGHLGEVAYRRGDLDTAAQAFQRNVELARMTPLKSADPYLWLSRTHLALGHKDDALRALGELAIDLRGDTAAQLLARAMEIPVRIASGERERAEEIAAEVAENLRKQAHDLPAEALLDLAPPLMALGDKATAESLLTSLVGNNHEHPEYLERARAVYAQAGLAEEGRDLVTRTAKAAVEIMNQGVKLSREGRLREALELTRAARERMPNNPRLLLNHAYLLIAWMEQFGRDDRLALEARGCIETARRLKPGEKRAGELLAKLELLGSDFGG
ncbi:MAG TPA: response regulator [Thiobacillaceae bacterium]|nr:response regulator [Thiobacillaceae bacterium]HNI07905.1 response regulator [Thiobacillaceae bacterium]